METQEEEEEKEEERVPVAEDEDDEDEDGFALGLVEDDHNQEVEAALPDDPSLERYLEEKTERTLREEQKRPVEQENFAKFACTGHEGFAVRVRPGDVATSLAKHSACSEQGASHVITSPMITDSVAHSVALQNDRRDRIDKSCVWNIGLALPVRSEARSLATGLVYKTPQSNESLPKPLRAAYFWLMTLFLAAPKLTAPKGVVPNVTMRVVPRNGLSKKLENVVFVYLSSVWKATRLSAFDTAQDSVNMILETAEIGNAPVKDLTHKCYETVLHCVSSKLVCMRDVALLYMDLSRYLLDSTSLAPDAFPGVTSPLLRVAMCSNATLRFDIIRHYHTLFHGPDAPPVLRTVKENGRTTVVNVPVAETALDMGDGTVFYPFRDTEPFAPDTAQSRGSVDTVMDGLLYLAINMNHPLEVPNSAALVTKSVTGETTGAIRSMLQASRLRHAGQADDVINDMEFINRLFGPRSLEMYMNRLLQPINDVGGEHPVHRSFFMQLHGQVNANGEPLLNTEVKQMAEAQGVNVNDIRVCAAPCLIIDNAKFDELVDQCGGEDPLTDRSIFPERRRVHLDRPYSFLSLLFSLDTKVVTSAQKLIHCPLHLRNITSSRTVVQAMEKFAEVFRKTENAGKAVMAFVKDIRVTDQRYTTAGGVAPPNPWPKNSFSHALYSRELLVTAAISTSMQDLLSAMHMAPSQVVQMEGNGGASKLVPSLTTTQVNYCLSQYNGNGEAAFPELRRNVLADLHQAIDDHAKLASVTFGSTESACNKLQSFHKRMQQEASLDNYVEIPLRLSKPCPGREGPRRMRVRPQACGGVSGGEASCFTNLTTAKLGPFQEFMTHIAHELHKKVYISKLAPFMTNYNLATIFSSVLDTAEQFNAVFLGDSTVGKSLFLETIQHNVAGMGLMRTVHNATDASLYTGGDEERCCILALNEVDTEFISNGENTVGKSGSRAPVAANESSKQATMLNAMESAKVTKMLKVATSNKENHRVVNFSTNTQITNTQHSWILTRNFALSGLAQAVITRSFIIHLENIPRPAKQANVSNISGCSYVPPLQDLICHLVQHDRLVCTSRMLPAPDLSLAEPVLARVFELQLKHARGMGCHSIFHTPGAQGGGKFATSRYLKQAMTYMSAVCQARLFFTLRNTLSPVLASLKSWNTELMHALVGLCSVANIEDAVTASTLFSNIDLTCRTSLLAHHAEVLLDDVVQTYLYVMHWVALRAKHKTFREKPFAIKSSNVRHAHLQLDFKDPSVDFLRPEFVSQLRMASLNTLKSPKYCWIIHLALHWYQSPAFRAMQGVLIQHEKSPIIDLGSGPRFGNWKKVQKALSMGLFMMAQAALDQLTELWTACKRTPLSRISQEVQQQRQQEEVANLHRTQSHERDWAPGHGEDDDDDDDEDALEAMRELGMDVGMDDDDDDEARDEEKERQMRQLPHRPKAPAPAPAPAPASSPAPPPSPSSGHTVVHFGVFLRLIRPAPNQPLVIPCLDSGLLTPSQMVCSNFVLNNEELITYYSTRSWTSSDRAEFLRRFDTRAFWEECERDVEEFKAEPEPDAGNPDPSSSSSSPEQISYGRGTGAQRFPVYRAPGVQLPTPVSPASQEHFCASLDRSVVGQMNALQLLKSSQISFTQLKGKVRHAVIRASTLQLQEETPLSMAWRDVRSQAQRGVKGIPNLFDRDTVLLTVGIGDTFGTAVLPRCTSKESDSYEDSGVSVLHNVVEGMRQYDPRSPNDHLRHFNGGTTQATVYRGDKGSLLKAAFSVRQSAFPLLTDTVIEGLSEMALEYWNTRGWPPGESQESACETFIVDLLEALLCDPRPWLVRYQFLDRSKLMPYPVNMEHLVGQTRHIKPRAGSGLLNSRVRGASALLQKRSANAWSSLYQKERQKLMETSQKRARANSRARFQAAGERVEQMEDEDDDDGVDVA